MSMLKVTSPYDESEVGEVPFSSAQEAEVALRHADRLFHNRGQWLPLHERLGILCRLSGLIEQHQERLVRIAAAEGGKPWTDSAVEVERGIMGTRHAVAVMAQLGGTEIPMGQTAATTGRIAYTHREPCGVVLAISAFNHPFNLIIHQVIPCVAAGCPVVIKPALTTPLSCQALVELLYEAGLPPEWCQMVVCDNEVTAKLAADTRLAFLSFIGAARVGWQLRSQLAPGVHCLLEHGGAAPAIILEDADLSTALPLIAKGGYYHAGQVCVSVQRLFVHHSRYREVADGLAALAAKLKVGDPLDPTTEVGPLIRHREVDRIEQWVNEAGGILTGGKRISDSCYMPTLLDNPAHDAKVSNEEIFGPVICLYPFHDREEAIAQANALPYSFQAALFGQQLDLILDTVQKLQATAVLVNDHTAFRADWMPFEGRQHSGLDIGGIPYAIKALLPEKLVVIRSESL
jgi:acyl-CoA reductase-like NAD-dependent aldehyde dehydrogenase